MTQQHGKTRKVFDGRYEILSIVGRGACSVVYHARHVAGGAGDVALKVLLNRKGERPNTDRLRKEALAMVSSRHRYVIRLDDFHSVGDLCYLSMEYAPESDLRKYVERSNGKLPLQQGERFLVQTAEAIGFIHRAGIIHRDIKPENILVMNENEIRLGDFGVAVLPGEESSLEELQKGVGTMDYMAPEVLEGIGYDQRADVYALGVTFYELLSGKHPFAGAPLMEQIEIRKTERLKHLSEIEPAVSRKLGDAVMRAMSFEREQRFSNGRELLQAVLVARSKAEAQEPARREPPVRERARAGERRAAEPPAREAKPAAPRRPARPVPPPAPQMAPPIQPEEIRNVEKPIPEPERATAAPPPPRGNIAPMRPAAARAERRPAPRAEAKPAPRAAEPEAPPPIDELPPSPPPPVSNELPLEEPEPVEPPPPSDEPESLLKNRRARVRETGERRTEMIPPPVVEEATGRRAGKTRGAPVLAERRSARSSIVKPAAMIAAVAAAVYIALTLFAPAQPETEIAEQAPPELASAPADPAAAAGGGISGDLAFPLLPAGMYHGSIKGIGPSASAPLTIVSMRDRPALAVVVGLEGWTPRIVPLDQQLAASKSGAQPPPVKVAANGFVLELTGQTEGGEVIGYFENIVTKERGSWHLAPVRQ